MGASGSKGFLPASLLGMGTQKFAGKSSKT